MEKKIISEEIIELFETCRRENKRFPKDIWNKHNIKCLLQYLYNSGYITDNHVLESGLCSRLRSLSLTTIEPIVRKNLDEWIYIMTDGKYRAWEAKRLPADFWENKNNVRKYIKWVCKQHNLNTKNKVSLELKNLIKHRAIMKKYTFEELIEISFPRRFKKWEIDRNNIREPQEVKEFMEWYLFKELKMNRDNIPNEFTKKHVPSPICYRFSFKQVVDIVFEGEYSIWDFENTSTRWDYDTLVEYVRWVMKKYNKSFMEVYNNRELLAIRVASFSKEYKKTSDLYLEKMKKNIEKGKLTPNLTYAKK